MMPIPNDTRHQSLSIFTDIDTLKKEERARRRVFRIQQVRQQSKFIASQVIARSKHIQRQEELLSRQEKEQRLKEWKHEKINSLRAEVTFGLEDLGGSHKAVEKELEAISDKDSKTSRDKELAKVRGRVASQELQRQLQVDKLREEQVQQGREELQVLEKIRARSVASLPVPPSTVQQPISYRPLTTKTSDPHKDCKNTVEVYNYCNPLPPKFCTQPDNVVQKHFPTTTQVGAKEQAEKEIQVFAENQCRRDKEKELTCWLGGVAIVRKTLEKQYSRLIKKLPELEKKESLAKPPLVTLADIEREEKRQHIAYSKNTKKKLAKSNSICTQVTNTMEPNYDNTDSAVPKQDLTAFPLAQFTAEETGALGATASSLQALLGSLVDESRRRLQEVVDDDFDFNDDDFEEPNLSPPGSPPPPISPGTSDVKVNVKTTHQVTADGQSLPASTITSEVHVSVTNKGRNKRRKKKSKSKPDVDFQSPPINTCSTRQENASKDLQSESKKDTEEVITVLDDSQQNTLLKSVEIDDLGVAYIKKTNATTERKVTKSTIVSSTGRGNEVTQNESVQVETNFTENVQYNTNNKHSFVSNSTQYHSPPANLLADENIDNYLKSIELEKKQVEELLQTKQKSDQGGKEIDLPKYINKLLTMTRDSVDQLSVSDATETSSDLPGQKKRKKKNKKLKTQLSVSGSSSNSENSPSTADSHVTLSVPSSLSGTASDPSISSNGQLIIMTSSEDSNLKFSESSSLKESSNSEIGHIDETNNKVDGAQSLHLDSTSYRTLEELSSHVPNNPQLVAPSNVPITSSTSSDGYSGMAYSLHSNDSSDTLVRRHENARLSTIVEADSSVVVEEQNVPDSRKIDESSSSMLDIEAELKKRGLPTLQMKTGDLSNTLLSPELDKKLKDLQVAPWSSSMMARMKKANSLSSSSDEAPHHLSESNISDLVAGRPLADQGICHSTPVSMEGPATSELTHGSQSQRFFLQDPIVSPISTTEEKNSKSFLSS